MKLVIHTNDSKGLLQAIYDGIATGNIKTWTPDDDGDLSHTATQWKNKAYLRPKVGGATVTFDLFWPTAVNRTDLVRGEYLGKFSEMLITHFNGHWQTITIE